MYLELLEMCQKSQTILITGPKSPDGDSIGACIALAEMIRQKSSCHIDISGIPTHQYLHLDGIDSWKPDSNLRNQYDLAIVVDGNRHRLISSVQQPYDSSLKSILIDHHKSTDPTQYDLAILDPFATSTCSMIYEIVNSWNCILTPSIAEALYVGILFDTGGFQHSNTTPETLRTAAALMESGFDANRTFLKVIKERRLQGWKLQSDMFKNSALHCNGLLHIASISSDTMTTLGCENGDLEGLVNDLRCTAGVHMAALIIENDEQAIKVSLRSNPTLQNKPGVDCAAVAQLLSERGGGHTRAAGASISDTLEGATNIATTMCIQAIRDILE